jgi:SLOG cluster3 family
VGAIFLSASVPTREPYSSDCRPQEIQAAVNALAQVVLGRKKLVWGGHPAITPLLWSAAQAVGVEYTVAVELFQSKLFQKVLPEENKNFANVKLIDAVGEDVEASLLAMRKAMFTSAEFEAAVFIGGMHGILDEHKVFTSHWPNATCIPIAQTGGATVHLARDLNYLPPDDLAPLDFVALLYRGLGIRPSQKREARADQGGDHGTSSGVL